ncbi:Uncharacterised protein [Metamycoplasma cloacale]|uniref:Uncharacterized protein n=1 Tax=Metamycoplasma cloacale TaxID=92401 RepID=A0A2Z4LMS5_9BACT|nr:hypothetical protein [Metamycoplasma cloacale]AWX42728.1 hypothetical protein DK849_01385 [Metamycoplasma cloacale]VEU79460.1 Uncharacterised protein [Metamycoplasma cloacale]
MHLKDVLLETTNEATMNSEPNLDNKFKTAIIVGIICTILTILLISLIIYLIKRKYKNNNQEVELFQEKITNELKEFSSNYNLTFFEKQTLTLNKKNKVRFNIPNAIVSQYGILFVEPIYSNNENIEANCVSRTWIRHHKKRDIQFPNPLLNLNSTIKNFSLIISDGIPVVGLYIIDSSMEKIELYNQPQHIVFADSIDLKTTLKNIFIELKKQLEKPIDINVIVQQIMDAK